MWLTFLGNYWKQIGIGVILIGIVGYIAVLKAEVSHYKTAATEARQNLSDCRDTLASLAKQSEVKQKTAGMALEHARIAGKPLEQAADTLDAKKGGELLDADSDVLNALRGQK